MSFNNIKSNTQAQKGFTIVELLIVVVVIAILAAITIVSYNGITNRANQSAAKAAAATVQKKAELYNSEVGNYPIISGNLTGATSDKSYALPTSAILQTTPAPATGKTQVQITTCGSTAAPHTATTIEGVKIGYWDFGATNGTASVQYIDVGKVSGTCAVAAS